MSKYSYKPNLIASIDASVELLCLENGSCTVTEILELAQVNSTPDIVQVVVWRAKYNEYRVVRSGRGYRIHDW